MKNTNIYSLPQFESEDVFNKEDFNDAFEKIDKALSDSQDVFDNLIIEAGDSNAEIVVSRGTEINLPTRLDKVDTHLDEIDSSLSDNAKTIKNSIGINIDNYPRLDGESNDNGRFERAILNEDKILLNGETYIITKPILLNRTGVVLLGTGDSTIIKNDGTGHAFSISKKVLVDKLYVRGNTLSKSGFFIESGCNIKNIKVYQSEYGIEFGTATEKHVVTCSIESAVLAYNRKGGIYLKSTGGCQINNIVFDKIYAAKNGIDADNLTSDGTPDTGHGIYINGGMGIGIYNSVTEYNSGAGIYIDKSTGYLLNGFTVKNHYNENNKYAEWLIDYHDALWKNINIEIGAISSFGTRPSNYQGRIFYKDWNYFPSSVNIFDVSEDKIKSKFAHEKTSLKPNDYFTYDYGSYKGRITKTHANAEGNSCLLIDKSSGGFMEYGRELRVAINPHNSYLIEIEYKLFLDGVGNGSISLKPLKDDYSTDSGATVFTTSPQQKYTSFHKASYIYDKSKFSNDTRFLTFDASINNGTTENSYFLINSLKIIPIDVSAVLSGATDQRPSKVIGMTYFDTTLNKPIWGGNASWVDATGTSV